MRVHHVITRLIVGGAQENTISSVLGLRQKAGMDVKLLAGPTEGSEGSLEPLVGQVPGCLVRIPSLIRSIRPIQDLRAYADLVANFRKNRPDIVHTHSGKAGLLGRLAARKAGVPIVIHGIHGPSFGPFQGNLSNLTFRTAERIAGRRTDHFIVVAQAMKTQYLAAGIGTPGQYTQIFSGFDLAPFLDTRRDERLARQLGLLPENFVVGTIARLFALKGHDDLIDAAPELIRQIPTIRFLWLGDGAWRVRLEQRIASAGIGRHFILCGLIPPQEVGRYLGLTDCLVHLSRREGLPRALPQALAAGRPVVALDCDGAGEVCRNDETGFLLRSGNREIEQASLISSLQILAGNPELRQRLGMTGRTWVKERFTIERLVDDQYQLYQRLARERGIKVAPPA